MKTVEGGGPLGVSDFPLFIDSVPAISGTAYTLEPGDYTASETTNADYAAGVWGGACAADGSVTLSAGDDVTCTITNTYQPPELATLTLVKTVEGGTLTADDFPVFLNGEPNQGQVVWGTTYPLPDGAYTAWEIVQDDYTTEGWAVTATRAAT